MDYAPRILLTAVLIAIGFFFPLAFLGAAWVAFTIYTDSRPNLSRSNDGRAPYLEADKTDWRARFRECMESPAEEAFFDTMVDAFDLKPADKALKGGGLTLRLQVDVLRYRLDFLVDEALVVEVDGAAWHSSPEAVVRDRKRDAELREAGYTILRIPAKITLYQPEKALEMVRDMRGTAAAAYADRAERKAKELKDSFRSKNLAAAAGTKWKGAMSAVDDISRRMQEMEERRMQEDLQAMEESVPWQVELIEKIYSEFEGAFDFGPQPNEKEQRLQSITDPANKPDTAADARVAVAALEAEYKMLGEHREFMREHQARLDANPEFARLYRESIRLFEDDAPAELTPGGRSSGK